MLTLLLALAPLVQVVDVPASPAQERADVAEEGRLELTDAEFDELWNRIVPSGEEEAWREIPWRATFWDGVVDANELDRPVLLFAMNGHPFGCT